MNALHFGNPTESTWSFSVQVFPQTLSARLPNPSKCVECRPLRLCPPLQQIVSYAASCQSIETSNFQKLFVRHPSSNSVQHSVARCVCNSFLLNSLQQTIDRHVIARQFHIRTHQCARHCHQVARVQQWEVPVAVLMTMMTHNARRMQAICLMWKPRVKQVQSSVQQISPFFMFGSASVTDSDILSCASLTRTLRSTSEDMALMIRVLHCSV